MALWVEATSSSKPLGFRIYWRDKEVTVNFGGLNRFPTDLKDTM